MLESRSPAHISEVVDRILQEPLLVPEYRPAQWESPIERDLWAAIREIGLNVETQVPLGEYRVDMLVTSRLSDTRVYVECDGAAFHHWLVDDFRDDDLEELIELKSIYEWGIAHVRGKSIMQSSIHCAVNIIDRWFPEHFETAGYISAVQQVLDKGIEYYGNQGHPLYVVGQDRPHLDHISGEKNYRSKFSDKQLREIINEAFKDNPVPPYERARAYILAFCDEHIKKGELQSLEKFLIKREEF